jgi:CRISPR/Cas system CSM-associated protein Csm2 small subunit
MWNIIDAINGAKEIAGSKKSEALLVEIMQVTLATMGRTGKRSSSVINITEPKIDKVKNPISGSLVAHETKNASVTTAKYKSE